MINCAEIAFIHGLWAFIPMRCKMITYFNLTSYVQTDLNFFCISEDILRQDNAIWISPDGKKVVYATFNDSQVQSVRWKIYGNGYDASVNPYPKEAFMRYPKVGI